jgi:hypothetical protein
VAALANNNSVALRSAHSLVEGACRQQDEIGRTAPDKASEAAAANNIAGDRTGHGNSRGDRIIELEDTNCLLHSVQHVVVAEREPSVTAIVAADGDGQSGLAKLRRQSDAAPPRRPARAPVLQVHHRRGQRDKGEACILSEGDRAFRDVGWLQSKVDAMPAATRPRNFLRKTALAMCGSANAFTSSD